MIGAGAGKENIKRVRLSRSKSLALIHTCS